MSSAMELHGKKILVVEDNKTINRQLTLILSKQGAKVIQARDGQEALEKAQQGPDVILMDLQMPGMDGLEAIKTLRTKPSTRTIPVIVLTGSKSENDRQQCLDQGANAYLTKPASGKKVVEAITALFKE